MIRRNRRVDKQTPGAIDSLLAPGTQAPEFSLPSTHDKNIALSAYRGQPVILAFYPADFSSVCGDQLALYNELLPLFEEYGAQLLAISVDSPQSHKEFAKSRGFRFPLLSDIEPKGAVARAYGAYDADREVCQRALYVVDHQGDIHWSHISPAGVNPGADGILRALESLDS